MAWYGDLMSGLSNAWESNPWGVIGNVASAAPLVLGGYSTITGSLRAIDQARQMDRVNKSIMEANRRNTEIYGREQAGREEANRINLLQYQRDQAARDEANRLNMTQWQRNEELRNQANALNLSGYQEQLQQTRADAARHNTGLDQLRALATSPINPQEFYKPISEAEATARRREIGANLVSRGVPMDSGYATNLTSEQMAGGESQRLLQALEMAMRQRGQQEGALAGTIPGTPQWGTFDPRYGGSVAPQLGSQYTPQRGGGFPTFQQPAWGQPQSFDPSGPFAWLYQQNQQRQKPTRQGDTGNATTGGLSFSANEMAQQNNAPGWSNYGSGSGWSVPQEDSLRGGYAF